MGTACIKTEQWAGIGRSRRCKSWTGRDIGGVGGASQLDREEGSGLSLGGTSVKIEMPELFMDSTSHSRNDVMMACCRLYRAASCKRGQQKHLETEEVALSPH